MKFLYTLLFMALSFSIHAQLEKVGVYGGVSFSVQNYGVYENGEGKRNGFFAPSYRLGIMTSFYGDNRFSYETGIVMDMTSIPNQRNLRFKYDDGLVLKLEDHSVTNIGIPLSATMRTNVTQNCVTYFKFSMINFFNIREEQRFLYEQIPENSDFISSENRSISANINYYSTDLEFGFGTFWYLKKWNAKFCIEPKVTVFQYQNSRHFNTLPERKIIDNNFKILARLGIELTLYVDMF